MLVAIYMEFDLRSRDLKAGKRDERSEGRFQEIEIRKEERGNRDQMTEDR